MALFPCVRDRFTYVTVVPGMRDAHYVEHFPLAAEVLSPTNVRKLIDIKNASVLQTA
jgi:hypothetical protein